jgi:hypothetical protein
VHATYARPVLRFLRDRFRLVRILTFERKLFPEINEDTVLVLAEGYGEAGTELRLVSLKDASALKDDPFELDGVPILSEDDGTEVTRPILGTTSEAARPHSPCAECIHVPPYSARRRHGRSRILGAFLCVRLYPL